MNSSEDIRAAYAKWKFTDTGSVAGEGAFLGFDAGYKEAKTRYSPPPEMLKRPFVAFTEDGLMLLRWTLSDGTEVEWYPEDPSISMAVSNNGEVIEISVEAGIKLIMDEVSN